MLQTLMVKLDTSEKQHTSLLETMHRFNEACNYISETAFSIKSANKIKIQQIVYRDVRDKFGLSAQHAIRAIAKVAEAYKRDRSIKPEFSPDGAIVYDRRILSWKGLEAVSILSLEGRLKIPVRIGEYHKVRMNSRVRGQADLILRNGVFYLAVVVEAPEPSKFDTIDTLGIDMGIVNLATDSDGGNFSGRQTDKTRERYAKLKAGLQKTGTRSAKRHLKKISGQERRFHTHTNHVISKNVVAKAKDTGRMIAIEDLEGIRTRMTVRKAQRSRQHSWAFAQLGSFIEYKAALAGVPLVFVTAAYTSQTCPVCNHADKRNRPTRDEFRCVQCGYAGSADHIGAINIAFKGEVIRPIVSRMFFDLNHVLPQLQGSGL